MNENLVFLFILISLFQMLDGKQLKGKVDEFLQQAQTSNLEENNWQFISEPINTNEILEDDPSLKVSKKTLSRLISGLVGLLTNINQEEESSLEQE